VETEDLGDLKVAIIHYWMVTWRGGEKVIASLLKLFPKADIYTLFYDERVCGSHLEGHRVFASTLNKPVLKKHYQKLFPLFPFGIKSLKLREKYDLIISSESGPAKGIENSYHSPHLCYIHTPMRYCWGYTEPYLLSLPGWSRGLTRYWLKRLKEWDRSTIDRVDAYVANSKNVAERVKKYYGKEAGVCYPPIEADWFEDELVKSKGTHYLSFGAITPYKNIGLLVEAFKKTNSQLIVIGEGSEKNKLKALAPPNVRFLGKLPFEEIKSFIRDSKALLFPGEEDFGMVPLEVMAMGIPVIALKKGGALETVVENDNNPERSSGIFFDEPNCESLLKALTRFETLEHHFDPQWIRSHAKKFSEDVFLKNMSERIIKLLRSKR